MTPPAATIAGQGATVAGRRGASAAGRRQARAPRTKSRTAPGAPRRVSGPIRGRLARPRTATRPTTPHPSITARAIGLVRTLPEHGLLDRVVRGRAWIALLGVMLAGIVAMQVEVLKLGASVGRSLALSSSLQSKNQQLRASVASLADDQRIERLAAGMGMVMPAPTGVAFISPNRANAQRAAHDIHAPDASAFQSALAASAAQAASMEVAPPSTTSVDATTSPTVAATSATAATATTTSTAPATASTTSTAPTSSSTTPATSTSTGTPVSTSTSTPATSTSTSASSGPPTGGGGLPVASTTQSATGQ